MGRMLSLRRSAFAAGFSVLFACDAAEETAPSCEQAVVLPPPDEAFILGLAGVPQGTFGAADAPDFEGGFNKLADHGFNQFVPVFLTNESGAGTEELTYFLPASATGVSEELSCTGERNPWTASARMKVVLPGYLLVPEVAPSEPLESALVSERMQGFVTSCLGGDEALLGGVYLQDEPANNYAGSSLDSDPDNDFRLENVAVLAEGTRAVVDAPVMLVEAPMPYFVSYFGFEPELEKQVLERWDEGVAVTAPSADVYGFDYYAVDLTEDFGVSAQVVEEGIAAAPKAKPIAVVQGFGYADMGIEFPTSTGRRPTPEEVRVNAFTVVAAGAEGVFWYGQSALTLEDPDQSLWQAMQGGAEELRKLSGTFALPRIEGEVGNAKVLVRAHADEAASYWLVVNPTNQDQPIQLAGEGALTDSLSGELVTEGELSTMLKPYQVATYRRAKCQ